MVLFSLSLAHASDLPPEAKERIDHALEAVDATEDQRSTVYHLVDEIAPQVKSFREEGKALRQQIHQLFLEPEIDRVALEALRLDVVDLFDRGTSFAFEHVADLAEVFSVEQRQKLHELREAHRRHVMERFHGWRDDG